jgi:hypothetical protein
MNLMKTYSACTVLLILSIGLFAVAQETATTTSSAAAMPDNAAGPLVTYKTVKTAAPYGTTNYVPIWTGLNTVANSALYQSGSNIGIGTTTPSAKLDVNGAINAATSFNMGGTPFAFGSVSWGSAYFGFAGNAAMVGSGNTATGYQALAANGADHNTATGYQALAANTSGIFNVADGVWALTNNTSGDGNTAAGGSALLSNTTGYYNTAVGEVALYHNTTGAGDTAAGVYALYQNTTGNYNTAVGDYSLADNTTGSDLTCIGYECNAGADGLNNATAIGAYAVVGASNSLVLGGTGKYAVKVGIGTATPSNILTIAQGAGLPVSDGWATFSSRRWKTNIQTLHGALGKVEQLRGVSYDLKANGQHEVGVIAEEVGAIVPEVVTWEKNGKDAQSVDYGRLTALLIEATKEQQALIREQREQISAQQAQIARLTRQVKTIQATLKADARSGSAIRTVKAEPTTVRQ